MTDSSQPEATGVPDALRARYGAYLEPPPFDGRFANPWPHPPIPTLGDVLRWKLQRNRARPPGYRARAEELPVAPWASFESLAGAATRLLWIGHASFLIETGGVRVVVDPIFGRAGGLVPRVTPPAMQAEELHAVDAVLVTHGHHDHFDPKSLAALGRAQQEAPLFVVPRGLGGALPAACRRVVELGWWEHVSVRGVRMHLVPAQHWHRRGAFDQNQALWGGVVVEGSHTVYHSGDTGYFAGFEAIGAVFGGIDVACLPLGAYEPVWFMGAQHMSPEQSLRAWGELQAGHLVGMHWGAYDLSDEPLDAGPRWLLDAVRTEELPEERIHVLAPGGSLALEGPRGATRATTRHRWTPEG